MKKWLFNLALCLLFAATLRAHSAIERRYAPPAPPARPERIISLAPGITETLYALGLGPNVAGVTQFCAYPPEVAAKPRVAGFSDINYEALLRTGPDLVVLPNDKISNRQSLERLGLATLALDTRTLSGLLGAVEELGRATGHDAEAARILKDFSRSMERARSRAAGRTRPGVLFSVMHSYQGLGYITEINAVGSDGFYSELIEIAGGRNVYGGSLSFPRLSREAVIRLDPEVIIDIIPAAEDLEAVRRDWQSLSSVSAIRNGRLFLFTDEADTVPGPRSAATLDKLSLAFHPAEAVMGEAAHE